MHTKPTLILIAGMYRSGSTWLYNSARFLLADLFGKENIYACWIENYNPKDTREYHVVKLHHYDKELVEKASAILISLRDLEGIAASLSKFHNGVKYTPAEMAKMNSYIDSYIAYPGKTFKIHYDLIAKTSNAKLTGKIEAIKRLAEFLRDSNLISPPKYLMYTWFESNIINLVSTIENLPIPKTTGEDYYDPESLLHPNHR